MEMNSRDYKYTALAINNKAPNFREVTVKAPVIQASKPGYMEWVWYIIGLDI